MPFPAIPSQIRCPNCDKPFMVDVRAIIDVGQEPELKQQILNGEINRAVCPHCGSGGLLNSWLIYHDPDKQLLVAYIPEAMSLSAEEQEHTVGVMVNAVMNEVPAEQRKAYLLQPRTVLSYEGLIDAILEGEGLTKEVIEKHRALLRLIGELAEAMDDEEAFDKLADANLERMDYEFYLILADLIEAQAQGGEAEGEASLSDLRERLLSRAQPAMGNLPGAASADDLVDLLLKGVGTPEWEDTVTDYGAQLDYAFFQALTGRMEAAQTSGDEAAAESLSKLREALLAFMDRRNTELREAEDEATFLIMELLEADDLDAAIREHYAQLDDVFFLVVARLRQTALSRKNESRAQRLTDLLDRARDAREEHLPPDVRLVSRLLRADYPDASNKLLEAQRGLVNAALLRTFDRYVTQLGEGINAESRERLANIRGQIAAKIEVARL